MDRPNHLCDDMFYHMCKFGVREDQSVPFTCGICKVNIFSVTKWFDHMTKHKQREGQERKKNE